jgi:hypothetical protein
MKTRNEAFDQAIQNAEIWDKRFPFEIRMILMRYETPGRKFYRLALEKSIFFSADDIRVLMDMNGFKKFLPEGATEVNAVRYEFEFEEPK